MREKGISKTIMAAVIVVVLVVAGVGAYFLMKPGPEGEGETVEPATLTTGPHILPTGAVTSPYAQKIEVPPGYEVDHILQPTVISPTDVAIGPDGDIFVTEWGGHRILRVSPDGTVSTYAEVELTEPFLAFNSEGDLFVCEGENLVRISPTGEKSIASDIHASGMAFGPSGDLFVLCDEDIIRFTPEGDRSVFATGGLKGDIAVAPSGEVFIANHTVGKIFKVDRNGTVTTLASGYVLDAFNIGFDNEGNLYSNQDYFCRVSLEDGTLSSPILRAFNVVINWRPFVFDRSGDVIFICPTTNTVVKASLDSKRVISLVEGIGSSHALAVGSSGDLFMGASNSYPINPGKVVRISSDGSISDSATGFTTVHDITFDTSGNMYVSDFDYEGGKGGRLLKVAPDATTSTILSGNYDLHSLAFHPASGDFLAFELNDRRILRITAEGDMRVLPVDFGGEVLIADIALDQQGNLISLVVFEENYETGPVHRGLFRISPDNKVTLLANIDTPLATSEDDVFVGPSGDIFVVGPEEHPVFRMLRITPEGDVSVFARNLPFDTLSLTINQSGDIFFTCSAGLFKIAVNAPTPTPAEGIPIVHVVVGVVATVAAIGLAFALKRRASD